MSSLFRFIRRRPEPPGRPLRDELLSIERLEERAKSLAGQFTIAPHSRRGARRYPRLSDNARVLRGTYEILAGDAHAGRFITPSAEWLLDPFPLVTSEIRSIRHDLPRAYYRQLPWLPQHRWRGHARVYAMALELIRHSDSRLDRSQLERFMNSYQSVAPLTIGELWAWPSVLKLALIENLRRLAEEILVARASRHAADRAVADSEAGVAMTVLPAATDTPMLRQGFAGHATALAGLGACHPMGRIGRPDEVAALAVFLASAPCGFLTGEAIRVDGGIGAVLHDPAAIPDDRQRV